MSRFGTSIKMNFSSFPSKYGKFHLPQHLSTGSKFDDREKIGQVITKDVSCAANGVESFSASLQSEFHGIGGLHNFDFNTLGAFHRGWEIHVDLLQEV